MSFYFTECVIAFQLMSAKEKAEFMDLNLQWATTEMLRTEIAIRKNGPQNPDDDE